MKVRLQNNHPLKQLLFFVWIIHYFLDLGNNIKIQIVFLIVIQQTFA